MSPTSYTEAIINEPTTIMVKTPRRITRPGYGAGLDSCMADISYRRCAGGLCQNIYIDCPIMALSGVFKTPDQPNAPARYSLRFTQEDSEWLATMMNNLNTISYGSLLTRLVTSPPETCPKSCKAMLEDVEKEAREMKYLKPIFTPGYNAHFLKVNADCPVWDVDNPTPAGGKGYSLLKDMETLPRYGQYKLRLHVFGIYMGPHGSSENLHTCSLSVKVDQILFQGINSGAGEDSPIVLKMDIDQFKSDIQTLTVGKPSDPGAVMDIMDEAWSASAAMPPPDCTEKVKKTPKRAVASSGVKKSVVSSKVIRTTQQQQQ